jgi:broad specificity phosphatase PhoE
VGSLALVGLLVGYLSGPAAPETQVVFVRHGETVANATGRYNERTLNTFSDLGEKQVAALTDRLVKGPRFDRIYVSPSPRAMRTIAPYLAKVHQKAEIWPLLYECCTGRRPKGAHATKFSWGPKVTIPADLSGLFTLIPGESRLPVAPDYNSGLAQVTATMAEWSRFPAGGRVLLVGHSGHGGQFIYGLTGKRKKVENAKEISFTLSGPRF